MTTPHLLVGIAMANLLVLGCLAPSSSQGAGDGEARLLVVPTTDDPPVLDREMKPGEWERASHLEATFVIADGSLASGEYPFQMWVKVDERNLYVAAVVHAGRNPWSRVVMTESGYGSGSVWYPDDLCLFLTNGLEGPLSPPSDWKCFSNKREQGTSSSDGYWNGNAWVVQPEPMGGGFPFSEGRPEGGTWGRSGYTDETLFWEIAIPRTPLHPEHDGFRVPEGGTFRMLAAFLRQGPLENRTSAFEFPRDTYPGDGHSPDRLLQPEAWMRFRVVGR